MVTLSAELRSLIHSGVHAHLTTINADGSPQVSVTWLALDGDEPYTFHRAHYLKLRNMERDARVVISFLAAVSQRPAQNYAVLYARARFDEHADLAKLVPRLRAPYLGAEAAASNPPASGYVIRYRVERIAGVGPWVDSPRS